ncbi:leucine--tRNA ligase [Candidatus Micrarchaeota archaeon CG1_02_47_40]|nr:MAG: leucine--tRNA ligase [Candidatus Micrarchaeota archaeon CG1_02_47_40]
MEIDYEKWQGKWQEEKLFSPKAGKGKKFFLTAAFPYPNSPQHIGHGRTYTTTDIYARYKRLQGYNVLFPMAFHVTGTPVLAMAERIAENDGEILDIFERIYHIPREKALTLTNPKELVSYFSREIEEGMKLMGFSIDWSRKFYTFDENFNKFIQWQFRTLHSLGYIKQGTHPIPWCPKCASPVSGHDTRGDIDPRLEEVCVVKFPSAKGFFPASTYRPETIYGVTNLWVNPAAEYTECTFKGEKLFLSKKAAEKLSSQFDINIQKTFKGSELAGTKCINPMTGSNIPILPASFVDELTGTGIVMSVPAHAPFDYLALRDAGSKILPIQVIELPGFGKCPSCEIVEQLKVQSQTDPKAQEATNILYKKEAYGGKMITGKYAGESAMAAKEKVARELVENDSAFLMHEIANSPLYCRCGALCTVKTVKNQWFIDYGNEEWKEKTTNHLKKMCILPEKTLPEYEYTIGWLKAKACTRSKGLGTVFPFDKTQMIEALSDSTIYMAFYTISHLLSNYPKGKVNDALFDYLFLGKEAENFTPDAKAMRNEFLYWYPLDSRHSALDLVHNHLTFLIFNHVAIFGEKLSPCQIVANGFVTMDGKKMSKSMGNILPLQDAIRKWGPDVIRFSVVGGAELSMDSDFSQSTANGVSGKLGQAMEMAQKYSSAKKHSPEPADIWLSSRLNRTILHSGELYESLETRALCQEIFYGALSDAVWYIKRAERPSLREFFEKWSILISPIMPHFAEEIWSMLGKKEFVPDSKFACTAVLPKSDNSKISIEAEFAEELLVKTIEDIRHILKLINRPSPKKIELYIASEWKRKLQKIVYNAKRLDASLKEAAKDLSLKNNMKECALLAKKFTGNLNVLTDKMLTSEQELACFLENAAFLKKEFGCAIEVLPDSDANGERKQKAACALPSKPSIYIE